MQESCTALHSFVQMYLLMLAAIALILVAHVIVYMHKSQFRLILTLKCLLSLQNRGLACSILCFFGTLVPKNLYVDSKMKVLGLVVLKIW